MAANTDDADGEGVDLTRRLLRSDAGDVLMIGPAMSGKRDLALELLSSVTADTGGRPLVVSTGDPAAAVRAAAEPRRESGGLPLSVVTTDGDGGTHERVVDSPADLAGMARAVTDLLDEGPRSTRLGARVLIDNVATLLLAADTEPVYRFMHALITWVTEAGGATLATLDTDGLEPGERPMFVGLFDTVVEVRHDGPGPEYSLRTEQRWHGLPAPEDR